MKGTFKKFFVLMGSVALVPAFLPVRVEAGDRADGAQQQERRAVNILLRCTAKREGGK